MTPATSLPAPATIDELIALVRGTPRLIAVGAGTKPRLSQVADAYARVAMTRLSGITEYEPSEFTITALAGTPLREIVAALAERGQYLPFDPLLVKAGATLGGTVAAGLSGPGRLRYGALRDFIIGVRLVDGEARLLRLGGKVVKNAAGFDLPKFLVGSAGRFGVMAELSFKVFPRPAATRTLRLEAPDAAAKAEILMAASAARWELDALDAAVGEGAVFARLAGPETALEPLARDILQRWRGAVMTPGDASYLWQSVTELSWAHTGGALVKVALTPAAVPAFVAFVQTRGARGWVSAAGNLGLLSLPPAAAVETLEWPALTLRGAGPLWAGPAPRFEIMRAVKTALDAAGRFPGLDD
ncbi:FAD-binding protein [Opitutus sp. ER46]|uniref:FAD-binding protein n=1 Tax=Opitutus sp. ER46 TaxID=2161864 RepID=UPI000D318402|nr:FAD-binding protein [Opitutus sp. ER46]PTX95643.1 2-hydroxy-acid oxidase [Opitutus sp. ER46]